MGKYRWRICGLVFFATTINYLDRAVISLLKAPLTIEYNWTETDYANIVIVFQLCYSIGLIGAGRIIDKVGTKIGYALATTLWSIAAMMHAAVSGTIGFMTVRGFLGVTEAGNFPAAVKSIAEWFPKKERAFATGIFNSGTNIGAILAPLTVPFIANAWGWKWAFILTGLTGFVWLIFWIIIYEVPQKHSKLSKAEFDHIHSDDEIGTDSTETKIPWIKLLGYRQTWAFSIGKFMTDPIWWFFLFWLPDFLQKQYHLSTTEIALPVAMVYTMAAVGSIFGGWLPMFFIKRGWTVFKSRKTSMFSYALFVLPVAFTQFAGTTNMWFAILLIGLAMSAHQAWSANMYTTVSDMFPKNAVGSVIGFGGMFGALGSIFIARSAGLLFDYYKGLGHVETGYQIMFIICSAAYILAWLFMHALIPTMKKIQY
jgi:ACS family hexuronate transporter-like MFS transporter